MTLQTAMRWTVALGVTLLVGGAPALALQAGESKTQQQPPPASQAQQAPAASAPAESKTAAKTDSPAPAAKPAQDANPPAKPDAKPEPDVQTPAPSPEAAPAFQSRKDKTSYAFGADLGRDLKRQKDDLNIDLFMKALKDALEGKTLIMTDDEVTAVVKTVEAEQKQDFDHARMMIAEKNRKAVEAFVAENVKKEGVITLPSGLQYKILKQGDGKMPTLDDHVVCNYRGTLIDGTEFDSSYKHNQPSTLPVKGVMAGWAQALQLMPVGSKWQIFIPPHLAFGDKPLSGIGPNAMLIFEVELLSIQDKPQSVSAR